MKLMDLSVLSQTNSSDYYEEDDPAFLEALQETVLPGDTALVHVEELHDSFDDSQELEPPPPSQPSLKRRRLAAFEERGRSAQLEQVREEIYGPSRFGEFGEYMRRKRAKLQIQNAEIGGVDGSTNTETKIFRGLAIYVSVQ